MMKAPAPMIDVKHKIASFEAHDHSEQRRRPSSSPASSPVAVRREELSTAAFSRFALEGASMSASLHQIMAADPSSPPSTTILASQNRIDRLKQTNAAAAGISPKTSATSTLRAPQPHDCSPLTTAATRTASNARGHIRGHSNTSNWRRLNGGSPAIATALANRRLRNLNRSPSSSPVRDKNLMHPDLEAKGAEGDLSDPDQPLVPRPRAMMADDHISTDSIATNTSSPGLSRLNKMQRIQRKKQIERRSAASASSARPSRLIGKMEPKHQSPLKSNIRATPPQGLEDDSDNNDNSDSKMSEQEQQLNQKGAFPLTGNNNGGVPHHWMQDDEEKSDKQQPPAVNVTGGDGGVVITRSTSSDYDTEADIRSRTSFAEPVLQGSTRSGLSASALTPDGAAFFEQHQQQHHQPQQHQQQLRQHAQQQQQQHHHPQQQQPKQLQQLAQAQTNSFQHQGFDPRDADDDDTYDSAALGQQDADADVDYDDDSNLSLSYEQRRQREEKERLARQAAVAAAKAEMEGPFMQHEDVEHYRKSLDTPVTRTALVVGCAATAGCILLGPVGLLVGAAAVGLTVGAMQIPKEQRNNMFKSAQESVVKAGDAISSSCVSTYRDSGISEHVPVELENCCGNLEGEVKEAVSLVSDSEKAGVGEAVERAPEKERGGPRAVESRGPPTPPPSRDRGKKGKVACLREGHIVPVAQIHALNPADQPRAWLDVLASAHTTNIEKIEAMEEIMILAKDKQRARIFVEEGILDSIMWILGRYFEKVKVPGPVDWAHLDISKDERDAAKYAATCCLTMGKAYCADIHTGGNLLLMSLYERGAVPEERQLAQMLHEVPHHVRVTKTNDPTIVEPSKEIFSLHQMTLPQAEEFASAVMNLAEA